MQFEFFKVALTIVSITIAIAALYFGYRYGRPHIVIEKIDPVNGNPFYHEVTIKNSGKLEARNLSIDFLNPDIITTSGMTIGTYGDKSKDAHLIKWSPIEMINMAPDQRYTFSPNGGLDLRKFIIQEAKLTLRFKYNDFLHIPRSDRFVYFTALENGRLVWKPIGKFYEKSLDDRDASSTAKNNETLQVLFGKHLFLNIRYGDSQKQEQVHGIVEDVDGLPQLRISGRADLLPLPIKLSGFDELVVPDKPDFDVKTGHRITGVDYVGYLTKSTSDS